MSRAASLHPGTNVRCAHPPHPAVGGGDGEGAAPVRSRPRPREGDFLLVGGYPPGGIPFTPHGGGRATFVYLRASPAGFPYLMRCPGGLPPPADRPLFAFYFSVTS